MFKHSPVADKSLPGEWWVAAGRGANYPINLARMPTTHRISSSTPLMASHFIHHFKFFCSCSSFYYTGLQVNIAAQAAPKRDSNHYLLWVTTHSHLSLLSHKTAWSQHSQLGQVGRSKLSLFKIVQCGLY